MENPFEKITKELSDIKVLVYEILQKPKEDYSNKVYTLQEAAGLLKVDKQTVTNHILRGNLKSKRIGRRILIPHYELFDSLNEVKSLKYKR
ncbi:helix-turn-helix domain-containing protein [Flavobacterium sp.]|uniref:helix-turn-helix domain-containing protein n=1 Tax=Flavobacterium sp. TaxID=239 RepID=UPI0040472C71